MNTTYAKQNKINVDTGTRTNTLGQWSGLVPCQKHTQKWIQ